MSVDPHAADRGIGAPGSGWHPRIPHKLNYKYYGTEGLSFMRIIPDASIAMCIFDPQYRGCLDVLKYGNEGESRMKGRSALPQQNELQIWEFAQEITRVLRPSGYVLMWMDKTVLCNDGPARLFMPSLSTVMNIVDLVCWSKGTFGMGSRLRCCCEYAMLIQKDPKVAKWSNHKIRDVWEEKIVDRQHPHHKPISLQRALIAVCTEPGEIVLDPTAGSFSTMVSANAAGCKFVGCELLPSPASWGADDVDAGAEFAL